MRTTTAGSSARRGAARPVPSADPRPVQLVLLDGGVIRRREWQLDERTRRIGRVGIAQARAILRGAHPPGEQRAS